MKFPGLPGLDISVFVSGRALQEHRDEVQDAGDLFNPTKLCKFVEATPGANFSVLTRVDKRFSYLSNTLEVAVKIDGVFAEGKILRPSSGRVPGIVDISSTISNVGGVWQRQSFMFAELKTTDGKPQASLQEKLKSLGEISVSVYRVREGTVNYGEHHAEVKFAVDADGIPEKALKGRAISSHVKFAAPVPAQATTFVTCEYPWGRDPVATATFKYRSHRDLQIEGIIPRSPSPVPLEERDPDSLSAEEARELVRIQRQKLLDQAEVKKEKREREVDDDEGEDGEVSVVEERRKRQRVSTDSGIEVIDLSNEDDEDDD